MAGGLSVLLFQSIWCLLCQYYWTDSDKGWKALQISVMADHTLDNTKKKRSFE